MSAPEIERRLLGACITGGPAEVSKAVGLGVSEDVFSDQQAAEVWRGLVQAATKDRSTKQFYVLRRTCGNEITQEVQRFVAEVAELEPTSIFVQSLVEAVMGEYRRRMVKPLLRHAADAVESQPKWDAGWAVAAAAIRSAQDAATKSHRSQDLNALIDEYVAGERAGKPPGLVGTGINSVDDGLGLLAPGEVLVLAGRPGVGKTALAVLIAENVVRAGGRAMVVSLEMSGRDLVGRIARQRAGRPAAVVRGCSAVEYEAAKNARIKAAEAMRNEAGRLNIFEVTDTSTVSRIEDRLAMLASADAKPDVVVIDYLQLIVPEDPRAPREQQVATMSRRIKLLALTFKVPVVLLSQLNRDSEKSERRPRMSDLRESGSIEQDADRIWLLYPDPDIPIIPDSPAVQVMIDQAKHRNGQSQIATRVRFFRPAFLFEQI